MAVAKTIEIISSSTESIEAAIRGGITKASETAGSPQSAPQTQPDILGSLIGAAGKFLAR